MTLLWMDGFEGFTTGGNRTVLDPVYDYAGAVSTSEVSINNTTHRGEKAVRMRQGALSIPTGHHLSITSPTSSTTWVVGFAFQVLNPLVETDSDTYILQFLDSAGDAMTTIKLVVGNLHARSGGTGGTKIGFGSARIFTYVWHFLEVKVTFDSSSGSVVAQLDDEEVMNVSGVNTAPNASGETSPSQVRFGGVSFDGVAVHIDDLYILDGAGSTNNDFLGDVGLKRIRANGDGATTDFVPSSGATHWLMVDDDSPDDDTTYNAGTTVGDKDLYELASLSVTPASIAACSVVTYGKKTDSGAKTFVNVCRSGTTESDSSAISPAETYGHHYSIFETDPDTAAAWLKAGVDAMQAGVKIAS